MRNLALMCILHNTERSASAMRMSSKTDTEGIRRFRIKYPAILDLDIKKRWLDRGYSIALKQIRAYATVAFIYHRAAHLQTLHHLQYRVCDTNEMNSTLTTIM